MTGFIAFTVSATVVNLSSSRLHPTCGSLLIALSLIDDGRLRTFLFVCVEVLRPSQPNGVMSSAFSLHFTG